MNNNGRLWLFLVLIHILIIPTTTYSEIISDTKIDSLRIAIDKKTGTDKISSQLDLAIQIINKNKDEAQVLAKSALAAAKTIGNKNLEIRSIMYWEEFILNWKTTIFLWLISTLLY